MDYQLNQAAAAMDTLFGPLSKDYCLYFYFLSIFGFVFMAIFLISSISVGLIEKKGIDFYLQVFSIALGYGVFYYQNRLLNSMCAGALKE